MILCFEFAERCLKFMVGREDNVDLASAHSDVNTSDRV